MKTSRSLFPALLLLASLNSVAQAIAVAPFDKVIVSPHIEVNLIQGTEEAVSIVESSVPQDKITIEVRRGTLRIYLEDAKEVTKNETVYQNGYKRKIPVYQGTQVKLTIAYKTLEELSVRGEETVVVESALNREKFRLKMYGEPTVVFNELHLGLFKASIYGTGHVKIASGSIKEQKYTAYGEAIVDAFELRNQSTKITSYGAAEFNINASEEIKLTAYGEAMLNYKGDPSIKKGIVLGELKIKRVQQNTPTSKRALSYY